MELQKRFVNVKNLAYNFLFVIVFLTLWMLFGWNYDNADYYNYKSVYEFVQLTGSYDAIEPAFEILFQVFVYLNFEYSSFLIVYSLIGLILIGSTIHKVTPNYNIVWALYLIFPFMLDVVQIRNFMSMSILIFSFRYLIDSTKINLIKFVICIVIASLFHVTSLFYFLFLLIRFSLKKIMLISLLISLSLQILLKIKPSLIFSYFNSNKVETYLMGQTSTSGIVFFLAYLITIFLIVYLIYKTSIFNKSIVQNRHYEMKVIETILKINIIILISYNFLLYDADFIRLQRNIMILNYIALSLILPYRKLSTNLKTLLICCSLIFMTLLSNWLFVIAQTYETVFKKIFYSNQLLDFLFK